MEQKLVDLSEVSDLVLGELGLTTSQEFMRVKDNLTAINQEIARRKLLVEKGANQ